MNVLPTGTLEPGMVVAGYRLERILESRPRPLLHDVLPVAHPPGGREDLPALLRVRGRNLVGEDNPKVLIAGEPVSVVKAQDGELLLAPKPHQLAGDLVVHAGPTRSAIPEWSWSC